MLSIAWMKKKRTEKVDVSANLRCKDLVVDLVSMVSQRKANTNRKCTTHSQAVPDDIMTLESLILST